MSQQIQGASFHMEHIVPRSKGGADAADNLALACPSCNLLKGDRTQAVDPETGLPTRLFHPRTDRFRDHFAFEGPVLTPRTPIGRATAALLELNSPRRRQIREVEAELGLYPPAD
jgi:hypothetical protein